MIDVDTLNVISAYEFALNKDRPGKTWFFGAMAHKSTYRALRVDPSDPASWYACAPFRIARIDGRAMILAAWPAPALLDPAEDWLDIETVIAWDPVKNTVEILEDAQPQIFGRFEDDRPGLIFGDPFLFFRTWLEQRAQFITSYVAMRDAHYRAAPVERDEPGVLMVGAPNKIRWDVSQLPDVIECVGCDARAVNAAIFKAARLPRIMQRDTRMAA